MWQLVHVLHPAAAKCKEYIVEEKYLQAIQFIHFSRGYLDSTTFF
jgi:hypothetical protein